MRECVLIMSVKPNKGGRHGPTAVLLVRRCRYSGDSGSAFILERVRLHALNLEEDYQAESGDVDHLDPRSVDFGPCRGGWGGAKQKWGLQRGPPQNRPKTHAPREKMIHVTG